MIIYVLLIFTFFIISGQCTTCKICIIDSTCGDDYIHFNISVSNECRHPMETYFSYSTDIDSEKRYINKTLLCKNCHIDLTIDAIHDAWDYMLKLESPQPTQLCSSRTAHCGGQTSKYIWIGTAGLSGLFIILGGVLCTIRCYRTRKQIKVREKKIEEAVINA